MRKINKMKTFGGFALIVLALLIHSPEVLAADVPSSTFVGNGGDAQDLDLGVTLAVIADLGQDLGGDPTNTLCKCSEEWQENDICRILKKLTAEEVKACRDLIIQHGQQLAFLAGRKSPVTYEWSYNNISVQSQAQKSRPVDAVTQTNKKKVIINRKRFSEMPPSYRVALVTHELFHLIQFNNGYMSDEQPAPPFANGRAMLNALGAAIAMEANEQEVFKEFQGLRDVSRASKSHRIFLESRSISSPEKTAKQLLKDRSSSGVGFGYVYEQGDLGLGLSMETVNYDKLIYGGITISEDIRIYHVSASYRLFPVNRYLSRWNETYVALGVDLGAGSANYKASSRHVEKTDKSSLQSVGSLVRVNIPLMNSLWLITGFEYRQVRYEYKKLRIKTIENQSIFTVGGGYGF